MQQVRHLNLHEYQSKKLMESYKVNTQRFRVVDSSAQVATVMKEVSWDEYVIKAQVHAGGRGKGVFDNGFQGGVHLTKDLKEIPSIVTKMVGHRLVTKQTPSEGVQVNKVMIAQALDIARETYFAIVLDRAHSGAVMVGSPEGGVDIEEVAASSPEAIFKESIDVITGPTVEQLLKMSKNLGFTGEKQIAAADQMKNLYTMFENVDATQVEINPFGETPAGEVVCFDAKINFDDNASFRQRKIFQQRDLGEEDPREVAASKHNLNYIGLDGNIGCLVNGAGLAMATLDILSIYGGKPANFLDIGGGVTEEHVLHTFKIFKEDPQVKVIMVNVFGGIVDCSIIANGIIKGRKAVSLDLPIIVRLQGTNMTKARELIRESKAPIIMCETMDEAAEAAVKAAHHL
eukprot:Sdes_comp20015_c0_seq5m12709